MHIPRTGEGAFYLGHGRFQINRIPINNITWNGIDFECRMAARWRLDTGRGGESAVQPRF
jgi:hypothetical protein